MRTTAFLSNRENVEIYSSNSITMNQAASTMQNAPSSGLVYNINTVEAPTRDKKLDLAKKLDDAAQKQSPANPSSNKSRPRWCWKR